MKVAIVGCIHGELDTVYEQLEQLENQKGYKIDLLLINGDFQSIRNHNDFKCVCIPPKYRQLGTFHQYYFGQRKAPILTIFIGGNHEASNYLITLPYGGWVAPNIYYMGYSNVIQFNGLRIGGISGIFNRPHTDYGHFERLPMNEDTKRSAYHTRHLEAYRLMRIKQDLDIFMSHDWPSNICHYGDINGLLRRKPFFAQDINSGKLGSPMLDDLLTQLKPRYWFSAHLHVRFEANVAHDPERTTKFLALDKCLPRRHYLEIIDIEPRKEPKEQGFFYDKEWLAILRVTNEFLSIEKFPERSMPDLWTEPQSKVEDELPYVEKKFEDLRIPDNFQLSPPVFKDDDIDPGRTRNFINLQTKEFCDRLGVDDPMQLILELSKPKPNPEEILLSDEESEGQEGKETSSGDDLFFIDKRGDNLQKV